MAKTIANCTILFDKRDFSGQMNQVSIEQSAAELDTTNFGNVGQARIAGLRDATISVAGLWEDTADPDAVIQADIASNVPITVALAKVAPEGTVAYVMNALIAQYGKLGAKVGNPLAFTLKCAQGGSSLPLAASSNSGRLARGQLALSRTITANGNSAVIGPLPAPAILQSIVAAVHVLAATGGGTLSIQLNSSAVVGMTSPTTRATFGAGGGTTFTAAGSDIAEIAGPIADTYWQFTWTITGGTSPSFQIGASLGNAY